MEALEKETIISYIPCGTDTKYLRKRLVPQVRPDQRIFPFLKAPMKRFTVAPRKGNNLKVKGLWKKNARDVSYVPSRGFLLRDLWRLDNAYISAFFLTPG